MPTPKGGSATMHAASPQPRRQARKARELSPSEQRLAQLRAKEHLTDAEIAEKKRLSESVRAATFMRLGESRMTKALRAIASLQRLKAYRPQPQDVSAMEDALTSAVGSVLSQLSATAKSFEKPTFKF